MIHPNEAHVHKKTDKPEKADNPAILRLLDYLQRNNLTISLQPYNGRMMPVIVKVAA